MESSDDNTSTDSEGSDFTDYESLSTQTGSSADDATGLNIPIIRVPAHDKTGPIGETQFLKSLTRMQQTAFDLMKNASNSVVPNGASYLLSIEKSLQVIAQRQRDVTEKQDSR
jgi:hypothetical protein